MSIGPIRRAQLVLAIGLLSGPGLIGCCFAQTPDPCAAAGQDRVRVESIDPNLEILLSDGRRALIAGIEPVRLAGSDSAGRALTEWLVGQDVAVAPLQKSVDRWGRTLAHVSGPAAPDGSAMISVAYALVDAGWARVWPGRESRACAAFLLPVEANARKAGVGLWADPVNRVLDAADVSGFRQRTGEPVIVEGHVSSVNKIRSRTYMNFGPARGVDFVVTVPRQADRDFTRASLDLKALWGKTIRVRGLLETRSGPQIEIDFPEAIEVIAADSDFRPGRTRPGSTVKASP